MPKKILVTESQVRALVDNLFTEAEFEKSSQIFEGDRPEGAPILRKLALKSEIPFGEFKGIKVQQVIDIQRLPYLRWIYYNIEGLSFIDEVLDIIGIPEEYRIKKPGTDPELGKILYQEKKDKMSFKKRSHVQRRIATRSRGKKMQSKAYDKHTFSKGSMQAWNQGKK